MDSMDGDLLNLPIIWFYFHSLLVVVGFGSNVDDGLPNDVRLVLDAQPKLLLKLLL